MIVRADASSETAAHSLDVGRLDLVPRRLHRGTRAILERPPALPTSSVASLCDQVGYGRLVVLDDLLLIWVGGRRPQRNIDPHAEEPTARLDVSIWVPAVTAQAGPDPLQYVPYIVYEAVNGGPVG